MFGGGWIPHPAKQLSDTRATSASIFIRPAIISKDSPIKTEALQSFKASLLIRSGAKDNQEKAHIDAFEVMTVLNRPTKFFIDCLFRPI